MDYQLEYHDEDEMEKKKQPKFGMGADWFMKVDLLCLIFKFGEYETQIKA